MFSIEIVRHCRIIASFGVINYLTPQPVDRCLFYSRTVTGYSRGADSFYDASTVHRMSTNFKYIRVEAETEVCLFFVVKLESLNSCNFYNVWLKGIEIIAKNRF